MSDQKGFTHALFPSVSLNRIGVHATPYCHRCSANDNLEHAMLDCPTVDNFWKQLQAYVDKITNQRLTLTTQVKLFGKVKTRNDALGPRAIDLVNWTLTLARWAIYQSAVNYRLQNDLTFSPEALFKALVRSHLRFQFKLYKARHTQYFFPHNWCIGQAFAKIENDNLVFTL